MGLLEDIHFTQATFFILPWKGYHTEEQIEAFARQLNQLPTDATENAYLFAVPLPLLKSLSDKIQHPSILFGSNTMADASPGSFSESVAAKIIQENQGRFALIGTSEMRHTYGETTESIRNKIKKALEIDLTPFLCIGETLEQFQSGESTQALKQQMKESLADLLPHEITRIAIIYEAPWIQKTLEKLSLKKLMQSYFNYRHALAEVVGPEVFSRMRLIDPFPNDLADLPSLLRTVQGKGIYVTDPEWLLVLLETKHSLGIEITQAEMPEPLPVELSVPRKTEARSTENQGPFSDHSSSKKAALLPEASANKISPPPIEKEGFADRSEVLPPPEAPPSLSVQEKIVPLEAQTESTKDSEETQSPPHELGTAEKPEALPPSASLTKAEKSTDEEEKEEVPPPVEELEAPLEAPSASPEKCTAASAKKLPELESSVEDELALNPEILTSPVTEAPSEPERSLADETLELIEKNELETRLELLHALNESLAECYAQIEQKAQLLPKLRDQFPEKLTKMTADLNQLDPELQDHINRGNVNFFTENPEKAKEASVVLTQLRELNLLLHETAAIPRDVDRLISKGRKLRKQLEDEWEYFRTHKKEIKEIDPSFELPPNPSQLLVKEPSVDLAPKDMGPSPLVGKKVAVVKTPPLTK